MICSAAHIAHAPGPSRRAGLLRACLLAWLGLGPVTAAAQTSVLPIDLIGVTTATFEWSPALGSVSAYLVFVEHDGAGFPPYPEGFTGPSDRRVTVQGRFGERLRVRVAAMGAQLAIGPYSPESDEVRFLEGTSGAAVFDFTGDGVSELVVQDTTTGLLAAWETAPSPVLRSFVSGTPIGALWQVVGAGDYDDDGRGDLLWRDPPSGRLVLCRGDGRNPTLCGDFTTLPAGWSVVPIGDTNGDRLLDVVLRGAAGNVTLICLGTGTKLGACGASVGAYPEASWVGVAPGDIDGDQRADLVLHQTSTGTLLGCPVVGTAMLPCNLVTTLGPGYRVAAIGDANGDNLGDLLLRDATGTGTVVCSLVAARIGNCGGLAGLDARWQYVGAGDYDGDRRADLVWRDAAAALVRIDFLSGLTRKGQPLFLPAGPQFRVFAR